MAKTAGKTQNRLFYVYKLAKHNWTNDTHPIMADGGSKISLRSLLVTARFARWPF